MPFNQYKYQNDFNKQAYDRASINFPKGQKAVIEEHWKSKGYKSLNAYVNDLIEKDMQAGKQKNINVSNRSGIIIGDNGTINM